MLAPEYKFVWAYMLEQGMVTTGEWNYYGGRWEGNWPYEPRDEDPEMIALRKAVKEVGVDWEKTEAPKSDWNSEFQGTDCESSSVETLIGRLFLKDGTEYLIGVGDADQRFGAYLEFIGKMAKDKQRVQDIFGEGEDDEVIRID